MSATDIIRAAEFTAERAWGARSIANLNGTTVRLHWTDRPYKWHVNDGEEVFAVMDGEVDMHYGCKAATSSMPASARNTSPTRAAKRGF